jgi:hypothetical protein
MAQARHRILYTVDLCPTFEQYLSGLKRQQQYFTGPLAHSSQNLSILLFNADGATVLQRWLLMATRNAALAVDGNRYETKTQLLLWALPPHVVSS